MAVNKATPLRRLGMSMLVASIVYGAPAVGVSRSIRAWYAVDYLLLLAIPTTLVLAGAAILYLGRQYGALAAMSSFSQNSSTVLYLRPFRVDTTLWRFLRIAFLRNQIQQFLEYFATREEQLAEAFSDFGRFVAIGRPGERLPLPGATRMYVGEEWQRVVTWMMQRASLVVLEASVQPGVLWELWQARRTVAPHRLIILLGPTVRSRRRYEEFRANAERLLCVGLPEWPLPLPPGQYWRYDYRSWVRGYIYFAPQGVAQYVPLHVPQRIYRVGMRPNRRALTYSLWPVYHTLRARWTHPHASSYGKYFSVLLFIFLPMELVLVFTLGKILF
jgi:hypothetical protein